MSPQLAVEIVFQELECAEAYTKRMEDAIVKRVEIDKESLESAENHLKNILVDFERQGNRMESGSYADKKASMYPILCVFSPLLFACLMCYLWVDAAKDRSNYKRHYEYSQEMDK